MLAHPFKVFGRHPQQRHKEPYRIASATFHKHFLEPLSEVLPCLPGSFIVVVGRLVYREFLHLAAERERRLEDKRRTGGYTEQECLATRFVDQGFNIFNLTLNRIRL